MISKETMRTRDFIKDHSIRAIALHTNSIMCTCNDSEGNEHIEVIAGDIKSAKKYLGY